MQTFTAVTHHRPDEDELSALRLLELWGFNEFPGLADAPFLTCDAGIHLPGGGTPEEWMRRGYVPIGIGGGIFDEHGKGYGKAAVTCVADYLGIRQNPALSPMLEYSLRADYHGKDNPFNFASIIKSLYPAGMLVGQVRTLHRRWFDALYAGFEKDSVFSGNSPFALREMCVKLRKMALKWLVQELGDEIKSPTKVLRSSTFLEALEQLSLDSFRVDALREIQRFIDRMDSRGIYYFDLAGIVRAMLVAGIEEKVVEKDFAIVLRAMMKAQEEFMRAETFFREQGQYLKECEPLRVAVIHSDSGEMQKAARRVDPQLAILIQFRPSGHVQVFSDQRRDLLPILMRLRDAEFRASGRKGRLSHKALLAPGTHPAVRQWFGFVKGKPGNEIIIHIFNSSKKTLNVPKTRLTESQIIECVREGLKKMKRPRGIERDRRPQQMHAS